MVLRVAAAFSLAVLCLTTASAQQSSQVLAALQTLSRSPQYRPTIQLITANQPLQLIFTTSPLTATAFADPTGAQYILATFGSPIYREILSNVLTSQQLAASPALKAVFAASGLEVPVKLGELLQTAQLPATGNAAIDLQTLEATLAQIAGVPLAPVPVPAPAPEPALGPREGGEPRDTLPAAGK